MPRERNARLSAKKKAVHTLGWGWGWGLGLLSVTHESVRMAALGVIREPDRPISMPMASRTAALVLAALMLVAGSTAGAEPALTSPLKQMLQTLPRLDSAAERPLAMADRIVVVAFFASWCPPCTVEFAHLNEVADAFPGDDVAIVAVNLFEDFTGSADDGERLALFLRRTAPRFAVVRGDEAVAAAFGGVSRIPTLMIFGRDGHALLHFIHERGASQTNADLDQVRATIAAALAAEQQT